MSVDTNEQSAVDQIIDTASRWPAVTRAPHPYDGVEFRLNDYEFGHVHRGWQSLHINYPRRMRDTLIEEGRTSEHRHFPNTGWTSCQVRSTEDVQNALWLLRVSYLYRAVTRRQKPVGQAVLAEVDVAAELADLGVSEQLRAVFDDVREQHA